MKKNLLAILAIIFCVHTFLFSQVPPSCPPGTPITPGENCAEACVNCSFSTYTGTTAGWQGDPQPPGWCSNVQNDQWIGFVASTTSATVTINPSNCVQGQGVQAAIYAYGCNTNPLECNPGCATCGNTPTVFSVSNMVIGQPYYLMIDGYSQDECDITVTVSPAQAALPLGNTSQISGPSALCPGATGSYGILQTANAAFYTWSSNVPGVLFNGQPGPLTLEGAAGASVEYSIPATIAGGTQVDICVTPSSVCQTGTQRCKTITVIPTAPPTVLPSVIVCNEDAPYILPWGELANESGLYNQNFQAASGCDSIVFQEVTILPALSSSVVANICQGDSVQVCGEVYKNTGVYQQVCTSFQGCDSTINFTVNVLAPIAAIEAPAGPLSCSQPSITLQSAASPSMPAASVKTWRNLATGATSMGEILEVTTAGNYELCTAMSQAGVTCTVCDTVTVGMDTSMAFLEASATVSGPVTCLSPATLSATSNMQGTSFTWISASGSVGVDSVYVATNPGEYVLAAMNGVCIDSVTVTVTGDVDPGITTLSADMITCNSPAVVSASSNISGLLYEWIGVDSTTITGPTFTTTLPGPYYLVTTNPANGCTWTGAVIVLDNTYAGVATISSSTLTCASPSVVVTATSDIPEFICIWGAPTGPIFGSTFTTSQPGVYTLITTNPLNGCTAEYQEIVEQDIDPGLTTITATPITCDSLGDLTATSNTSGLFYSWVTPGGPILSTPSFTTNAAGVYTLTTTNPANGCTWTESVTLTADTEVPQVVFTVAHATTGQSNGAISLNVLSGTPPFTFEWTHNGMFFSDAQNLVGLEPGIYTVKITGDNGCVTTVDIQVMSTSATTESTLNTPLWKIAPNPASEYIQILWAGDGDAPGAVVNGFDVTGKLMFNVIKPAGQAQLTIPCSQYPAGMYHLEIQPDNRGVKSVVRVNVVH